MNKELFHRTLPKVAVNQGAKTNTGATGADINLQGYESALFLVQFGTWTDGSHTYSLQEADDNGSGAPGAYTNVAAGDMLGAFAAVTSAAGNNTVQVVSYIGFKQWVRAIDTTTGATTGAVSGAVVVLSHLRTAPSGATIV